MNSYITIQVRVAARQAQTALRAVEADVVGLEAATGRSSSALKGLAYSLRPNLLQRFGNQLQWTGRALMRNFTYPLAIAGGAALKFELDNERAMTGVTKVYGDGSKRFNELRKTEIPALRRAFEALSNEFAVNQAEVIGIGAAWAQAGASGIALAKSVKLTLETMILGEMEAGEATQALIAIQAQYGQSIEGLSRTIDVLNMVENQTGISMQGLVQGFARAAGTAREAGVDVQHLGALLAALTPAAGTAAQAGNALKTILSRLFATTSESAEVMGMMNIQVESLAWQSLNGSQRLELMAQKFEHLSDSQKLVVSSIIASRYQINRFSVLMREVNSETGYYAKSLESTSSAVDNFKQKQYELNTVLQSNPQRLKQIWIILQNAMADIITPLIPAILYLAGALTKLFTWFSHLDPAVQKLIGTLALLVALVGPLVLYIGALGNLLGTFAFLFGLAGKAVVALVMDLLWLIRLPLIPLGAAFGYLGGLIMRFGILAGIAILDVVKYLKFLLVPFRLIPIVVRASLGVTLATMALFRASALAWMASLRGIWVMVGVGAYTIPQAVKFAMIATGGFLRVLAPMFVLSFTGVAAAIRGFGAFLLGSFAAIRGFTAVWATQMRILFALVGTGVYSIPGLMARGFTATVTLMSRFATTAIGIFRALPLFIGGLFARLGPMLLAVFSRIGPLLLRVVTGPIGLIITGVLILFGLFKDQIVKIWDSIIGAFHNNAGELKSSLEPLANFFAGLGRFIARVFNMLPESVRNAMLAVVRIVASAAQQVYELFQYLNPFAHHSPSLVESTEKGMGQVQGHHEATAETAKQATSATAEHVGAVHQATAAVSGVSTASTQVAKPIDRKAIQSIKEYERWERQAKNATDAFNGSVRTQPSLLKSAYRDIDTFSQKLGFLNTLMFKFHDQRIAIKKIDPGALASFDKLIADLGKLNKLAAQQERAVNRQQAVVDKWAKKLDVANAAVDREQAKLDKLQKKLDSLNAELERHQQALQNWAEMPIKGERKMSDAIFENEIAQKKLRLEMMKIEDVTGPLDKLQNKLATLQGEIEKLRGEQASLRESGAGSEITGEYDKQIKALQDQQTAIQAQAKPLQDMQDQLDQLARKGEELQLINDITFDPLHRQIDQLVTGLNEASFDRIVAGIQTEQAAISALQPQIDAATAAVERQQGVLDAATAARDALSDRYDRENAKLQVMQDEYNKTTDAINAVTQALNEMSSAADQANQRKAAKKADDLSPGGKAFKDAAGANFPDVGGAGKIGREGGLGDQSALIDEFTQNEASKLGDMFGDFDLFAPIRGMWDKFVAWWDKTIAPFFHAVGKTFSEAFDAIGNPFEGMDLMGPIHDVFDGPLNWIKKTLGGLWDLFGPDIKRAIDGIVSGFKRMWTEVEPQIVAFKDVFKPLGRAIENLWPIIKPFIEFLAVYFVVQLKIVAVVISSVLGPAFEILAKLISGSLQIIHGVILTILGVFNLFVDGIKLVVGLVKAIITGDFSGVWSTLKRIWSEDLANIVKGIWDIFDGMWRQVEAVFVGAFDLITGLVMGFVHGIVDFFQWLYDILIGHSIIPDMINGIVEVFKLLLVIPLWIWNNVLVPIKDFFVSIWRDHIKPFLEGWVDKAKNAWEGLKNLGQWVWDHVLVPIKDFFKSIWTDHIKPFLESWKEKAVNAWDTLVNLGQWVWNNVLVPVKDFFVSIWADHIKPFLESWKDKAVNAWDSLTKLGQWVWDNVLVPIKDFFVSIWKDHIKPKIESMATGFQNIFAKIGGYIKDGINLGIDAVNLLIDGLNAVGKILPGVSWNISHISKLESGGVTPAGAAGALPKGAASGASLPPFVTNGARAIVGEGNPAYPEYVIPTDPRFHDRAMRLLFSATHDVTSGTASYARRGGMGGPAGAPPAYGIGGIIGGIGGAIGGAVGDFAHWAGDKVKQGALMAVFGPLHAAANAIISRIPWDVPKDVLTALSNGLYQWVKTGDSGLPKDVAGKKGSGNAAAPGVKRLPDLKAIGGTIPALANGAWIKHRQGGVLVRVGEGNHDEVVKPLPRGAQDLRPADNKREIHFHGELVFPNITTAEDAEEFISNLESLAG